MVSLKLHKDGGRNPHLEYKPVYSKITDIVEAEYSDNIITENVWAQCEKIFNQVQLADDNFKHNSDRV